LLAGPRFALLDRIGTALAPDQVDQLLHVLTERSITYVSVTNGDFRLDCYDTVLELASDGSWSLKPVRADTADAAPSGTPAE
jgi:putative ATP-binding cassette transporter